MAVVRWVSRRAADYVSRQAGVRHPPGRHPKEARCNSLAPKECPPANTEPEPMVGACKSATARLF